MGDCCLLPQCEALRACRSDPIVTQARKQATEIYIGFDLCWNCLDRAPGAGFLFSVECVWGKWLISNNGKKAKRDFV